MPRRTILNAIIDPNLPEKLHKTMLTLQWTLRDLARISIRKHIKCNVFKHCDKLGLPATIVKELTFTVVADEEKVEACGGLDFEVLDPGETRGTRGWRLREHRRSVQSTLVAWT